LFFIENTMTFGFIFFHERVAAPSESSTNARPNVGSDKRKTGGGVRFVKSLPIPRFAKPTATVYPRRHL
jgi:hypothetical protein